MNIDNFPAETRAYNQWLVWRSEAREGAAKPTKVPYNVKTRQLASVTNPATWCSYDDAKRAIIEAGPNLSGAGFVLTAADPFAVVDLDDTHGDDAALKDQHKIHEAFASYSEWSPSGVGVHIWVKAEIEVGRRRHFVELYNKERFMTVTGKVLNPSLIMPRQELVTSLFNEMGGSAKIYNFAETSEEKYSDQEILTMASNAVNGDKFLKLYSGDWHAQYNSQSEADLALMNFFGFYSQNRPQLYRLFRESALGQREKAQRDAYLDYAINKSFDQQLPKLDLDGLLIGFRKMVSANRGAAVPGQNAAPLTSQAPETGQDAEQPAPGVAGGPKNGQGQPSLNLPPPSMPPVVFPPGLVGEIAQFILDAAPRPVAEIALAGAIGFLAGIAGRAYNISGSGLNQYILALAPTGTGKEAIAGGTDRIISALRPTCPTAGDFVGPGEIVSSAGLIKWIAAKPCVYTIVGEFGIKLSEMSSQRASPHLSSVKRVLLDFFQKSGANSIFQPVAYSDKEKAAPAVRAPCLTLIGESVPERFYRELSEDMIADGLLPRFMLIEYLGPRPARNESASLAMPSIELLETLGSVVAKVQTLAAMNQTHDILSDSAAQQVFDRFDKWCDGKINHPEADEVVKQLWNRAHLKALKLAGLVAVGINYINPVITVECANYATNMIVEQTERLVIKFKSGDIGEGANNESRQAREVIRIIKSYMTDPYEKISKYGGTEEMHRKGVIPFDHIQRRLVAVAMFRLDRIGATNAIRRAVELLLGADDLREVPKVQMQQEFGKSPRSYMISNPDRFKD